MTTQHHKAPPDRFRLGDFIVSPSQGTVSNSDGPARLEPRVMRVLVALSERGGQVVSRADLFDAVWPNQAVGDAVMGDERPALDWLERAFANHSFSLTFLDASPYFDSLRSSAAFTELRRRHDEQTP